MLGMETRSRSAGKLRVGDYLPRQRATITGITPTEDPWLPADALDVALDNGQVIPLMPHDFVSVICDGREP